MFDTRTPETTTRIWWVRHAPVRYPADGTMLFYGGGSDWDAKICPDPKTWQAISAFLPADPLWVTSGMRRAEQTAQAIQQAHNSNGAEVLPLRETAFMEQHFGDWEGKTLAQIDAQAWQNFWRSPHDGRAPNGENFLELIARVRGGLDTLLSVHRGKNIVIVAHGGTIRAALSLALAIPPQTSTAVHIANNSLTKMTHYAERGESGGNWSLNFCNIKASALC